MNRTKWQTLLTSVNLGVYLFKMLELTASNGTNKNDINAKKLNKISLKNGASDSENKRERERERRQRDKTTTSEENFIFWPFRWSCWWSWEKFVREKEDLSGFRHSSVDSSVPSILLPRVWLPSTPSMLLSFIVKFVHILSMWCEKRTKINKKRPSLAHF